MKQLSREGGYIGRRTGMRVRTGLQTKLEIGPVVAFREACLTGAETQW